MAWGFENQYTYQDYDHVSDSNFIKFGSESTKFGLLTTSFEGKILSFSISGKMDKDGFENVLVKIPVSSLSTDLGARDEKMQDEILNKSSHPEIRISFLSKIPLGEGEQRAVMNIQGRDHPINLSVKVVENAGVRVVSGSGSFKLTELGLPDPSIAIAKVRDQFDLSFRVEVK
jgi:polyisoprenoid-binding protein YceI